MTNGSTAATPTWSEALATGIPAVDQQHQALFHCLAELENAADEGTMLATFHAMAQLSRYTREHFADEELLMRTHRYPGLETHLAEHADFRRQLLELRRGYLDHDISADLIALLHGWLIRHVQTTDMDYVPYLTTGVRRRAPVIAWEEQAL